MIYKIENEEVTREEFLTTLNQGNHKVMADENEQNLIFDQELLEKLFKQKRSYYMDAYRKYQAAVNYGEFERVSDVDGFIGLLLNKDWTALENIIPQIRYFTGEIGLAESGLIT